MIIRYSKWDGKEQKESIKIEFDMNELGHEICMGIRHGLFGANSSDDESLWQHMSETDNITEALFAIASALKKKGG